MIKHLDQTLRKTGYIFAFFGILAIAAATIGVWFGKHLGLGEQVINIFGAVSFAAMLVVIGVAMACFWLADRIGPRGNAGK